MTTYGDGKFGAVMEHGIKHRAKKVLAAKRKKGLPSSKTSLSPGKARTILHDKEVRGHKLTDKQRRFMGAVASKGR